MEMKINREELCSSEVILKTKQEQSIELDYVLPDYYPEIFRLLKHFAAPYVVSYNVSGSKLTYELCVYIKISYSDNESSSIHVVDQKMIFTKTVELGRICNSPMVRLIPNLDYLNCRAVNSRRLDIRGAVSVDICISDETKTEVICDAYGMGIELEKKAVEYPVGRLYSEKQFTVNDDFELGISKPVINDIIYSKAIVTSTDKRIIANKAVTKGEISIDMLYTCDESKIESLSFTLPFSQIVDMEGLDDRFDCYVDADVVNFEITPRSDGDGNTKVVDCSVSVRLKCTAVRMGNAELVCDEFSTEYETSDRREKICYDSKPQWISSSFFSVCSVEMGENEIERVYGAISDIRNYSFTVSDDKSSLEAAGTVCCTVIASTLDSEILFCDKEYSFTYNIPLEEVSDEWNIDMKAVSASCSYNIGADGKIEVKTEIALCGNICCLKCTELLVDIFADENLPVAKDSDCTMKLYFCESGERLWDIAKRFHSSAERIIDENDIDDENISSDMMLIIPMI